MFCCLPSKWEFKWLSVSPCFLHARPAVIVLIASLPMMESWHNLQFWSTFSSEGDKGCLHSSSENEKRTNILLRQGTVVKLGQMLIIAEVISPTGRSTSVYGETNSASTSRKGSGENSPEKEHEKFRLVKKVFLLLVRGKRAFPACYLLSPTQS